MTCELSRVEGIPVIMVGGGNERYTSYLTRVVVGVSVGDASSESTKVVFIGFTTRHSRATLAPLSQLLPVGVSCVGAVGDLYTAVRERIWDCTSPPFSHLIESVRMELKAVALLRSPRVEPVEIDRRKPTERFPF